MDVERVELVDGETSQAVFDPEHLVLDQGQVGYEHAGGILALNEYPI
jgi:hypothetical protein